MNHFTDIAEARRACFGWSEMTRLHLEAAGKNQGRIHIPESFILGYAMSLVRDGAATWVEHRVLELTDKGWEMFYVLTDWSPTYYSRLYVRGVPA